jgi:hypothetical protein
MSAQEGGGQRRREGGPAGAMVPGTGRGHGPKDGARKFYGRGPAKKNFGSLEFFY